VKLGRVPADKQLVNEAPGEQPSSTAPAPVALSAILDAIPDVVLIIDTFGSIRYANAAVEAQLGYRPADRLGRSLLDLIHPDDVANVLSSIETVQGKTVGTPVDVRVLDAAGAWHWFEEIGTNVVLDDGSPAILCVARNITQRRVWEVAAGDTARAQQIIHVAPTITLLLDGDGVVTSVNAAFTRMLGHDQSKVIGHALVEFMAAGHDLDARHALDQLAAGTTRVAFEARMRVVGQAAETCPVRFEMVNHLTDPVINGIVVSGYDVSELEAAREELEHLASHDPLTGLATRPHLARHIERMLAAESSFATLYIDLDRFKPVNDMWGHDTGDDVLRLVTKRLRQNVGQDDVIARVGGDEFVIITSDVRDYDSARRFAERLEAALSAPYELPAGGVRIGASVGVSISGSSSTVATVLADADADMYAVKAQRRPVPRKLGRIRTDLETTQAT
jgi:diguanylate cyclase